MKMAAAKRNLNLVLSGQHCRGLGKFWAGDIKSTENNLSKDSQFMEIHKFWKWLVYGILLSSKISFKKRRYWDRFGPTGVKKMGLIGP